MTVHGDNFLAVSDLDQIKWIEEQLKSEYDIKAEVLGPQHELSKEIKILNRSIRWSGAKLECEVDSRHGEVIIEVCEVQSCRAAKTSGVQEAVVDGSGNGGIEVNDHERDEVPWSCSEDRLPCHGPQRPSICGKETLS